MVAGFYGWRFGGGVASVGGSMVGLGDVVFSGELFGGLIIRF